jgi:hypothetical protein
MKRIKFFTGLNIDKAIQEGAKEFNRECGYPVTNAGSNNHSNNPDANHKAMAKKKKTKPGLPFLLSIFKNFF